MDQKRFPIPPFTEQSAKEKVQKAEDAWNTKNPILISEAYTIDTEWRNRDLFINGRKAVQQFLNSKWEKELNYKLKKELWVDILEPLINAFRKRVQGVPLHFDHAIFLN